VFILMIDYQLNYVEILDLILDFIRLDSLKLSVRNQRGKVSQLKVVPNTQIPFKWKEFLQADANKTDSV